jgi:ribosomal-protein-alanine N-acetyltransferase
MTDVGRHAADGRLALRAIGAGDLDFLDRLCSDPEALGPFEWPGFGDVRARRRRWEQDGYAGPDSTVLAVVLADGTVAGIASWSTRNRSQNIAEQKALERIGFEREGVMREVAFRNGAWRDAVIYALLRDGP